MHFSLFPIQYSLFLLHLYLYLSSPRFQCTRFAGTRVRGHEFHRTVATPGAGPQAAWQWSAAGPEGFVSGGVHASYLHLNWAGAPALASRFVSSCAVGAPVHRSEQHAHR